MELKLISNKKAHHDYHILDVLEAGVILTGAEVKAIREHKANLNGAWVDLSSGDAILHGLHVSFSQHRQWAIDDPERQKKLLLHSVQIEKWRDRVKREGLTVVPTSVYRKDNRHIKVEVALVKGKKEYDKKESLKIKDLERERQRS